MNSNRSKILFALAGLVVAGFIAGWLVRVRIKSEGQKSAPPATSRPASSGAMGADEPMGHNMPDSQPMVMKAEENSKLLDLKNPRCPVMGGKSAPGGDVYLVYNGLKVHFCCPGCDVDFLEDPVGNLRLIREMGVTVDDRLLTEAANPVLVRANNRICPVDGKDIPEGKEPAYVVHRGVRIALSSDDCVAKFGNDPDGFLIKAAKTGEIPQDRLAAAKGN
ncbi:MAG: hypothetical protein V3W41_15485 [Planctomycetota bacterium]